MEIHCPLINQNLSAETDGTLKVCCDMLEIRDKSTGLFISRDSHTPNQAFNSLEFNSIRENFNLGIKDPHCKKCWDDESNGVTSRRMFEIEQDGHKPSVGLKSMTLSLGNTCNIKCRTCGSRDSTTWLKEEYDLKADYSISFKDFRKQNTIKLKNDSKFYRSFIDETLPNLDELGCLGGEPFMLKDFWNLLEIIIEKKLEKKITLTVSTNCTFWPDKKVELLSQFSNLNIACSIDGLGQRFNYMRHPADWAEVSKNLDSMMEK